jgi:ribosome-associated protein YbcJ (S4-like RNA binding protein)
MTFTAGTTLFEIEKIMINECQINIKGDENKRRNYKLNKSKRNVWFASLELLFSDTG